MGVWVGWTRLGSPRLVAPEQTSQSDREGVDERCIYIRARAHTHTHTHTQGDGDEAMCAKR
jgi:hypothetical protein